MHIAVPLFAALLAAAVSPLHAETIGGNPGPQHNYVCPHADGQPALECFFDAVQHLYTMCRNVKSIEIIEFGYEKSADGTNAAKSEYCLDKQKQNIARPYQAALKEAKKSQPATEGLQGLHALWLSAMTDLKWHNGESDDDYKARVAKPYEQFKERIATIRAVATVEKPAEATKAATGKAKSGAKSKSGVKPTAAKSAGDKSSPIVKPPAADKATAATKAKPH